jgi:hypothetical protein
MKYMIRYKVLILILLAITVSCQNEGYDPVFDEKPAERSKLFIEQFQGMLATPEKGWIIQYFPTETSQGYNLYARFDTSGEVVLGAKNLRTGNVYKEYTSRYGLTFDVGPMLNFVTYNENLHPFSDPDLDWSAMGDFEFSILDVSDNLIRLKGKKSQTDIWMIRLDANTSGEEYILRSEAVKNYLFVKGSPTLNLNTGNKTYSFSDGYTSMFKIIEASGDTTSVSYIPTLDGFRLYQPLETGDDVKIRTFQLNEDKSRLICTDLDIPLTVPPVTDFFINSQYPSFSNTWNVDKNRLGGTFAAIHAQIVENCKSKYKEEFKGFFFIYKLSHKSLTLSFKSGSRYEGTFDFDLLEEPSGEQIVFKDKGTMDDNGSFYLNNVPGFDRFLLELQNGNYTISTEYPVGFAVIKIVSVSNPDNWFELLLN